jgi:hypothetical protein
VVFGQNKNTSVGASTVPCLALCDLFMFPKLKMSLKGAYFESLEDIQSNVTTVLK